jgi:AbrB family looped-hinge helix DNA binding protein
MPEFKTRVAEDGRIVIPAECCQALGLHVGDEVILRLEAGVVRIFTPQQALKRAQELIRGYTPQSRSLGDELIAERNQED